jgi:hypothetical protein
MYPMTPPPPAMIFESIGGIAELETVSEQSPWQDFERLVAFIFEKHAFSVLVGTVRTRGRKRRQYDVIARKGDRIFLVECKKWSGSRYRLSALRRAILQHRERTGFYEDVAHEPAVPVIVTLIEEEIRVFEGVPIVPVLLLDAFVRELDNDPDLRSFPDDSGDFFGDELPGGDEGWDDDGDA